MTSWPARFAIARWSLDARLPVGLLYEPIVRWGVLLVTMAVAASATFLASRQAAAG